jgi:hypothetical protein
MGGVMNLTNEDWSAIRKLAKARGTTSVYAKMFIALSKGKGVRLSFEEIRDVFADDAVMTALWYAIPDNRKCGV